LKATYDEILLKTHKVNSFSEEDLLIYGVNAIPEAFAGLVSLTQKKKLEKGMNLLVDIGGGTTDIAFFTITEDDLPDIHSVHSLFKGLNFIYENIASASHESDIVKIQQMINQSNNRFNDFEDSISIYKKDLHKVVRHIINSIKESFLKSTKNNGLHLSHLNEALTGRPIIYSGGGSSFDALVDAIGSFSDPLKISKETLSISTLKTDVVDDNLFSILSTSYGLSIPLEEEIILTDVSDLFNHIETDKNSRGTEYDHGLTDY
jgi:actin-like ATPase involved in cell morphogenesis